MSIAFIETGNQKHEWVRPIGSVIGGTFKSAIDMCLDEEENVYIIGEYDQDITNEVDTALIIGRGKTSPYIAKFDKNGTPLWLKGIGTNTYTADKSSAGTTANI